MSAGFIVGIFAVGWIVASASYAVAAKLRLMAIVDLNWTAGLGLVALALLTQLDGISARALLVLAVVLLWSARISWHLLRDRVLTRHEDGRYADLRDHWGPRAGRNFYLLFLAQMVLVFVFSIPVYIAMSRGGPLDGFDLAALALALLSLGGEALADRQLARFRAEPANRGGVCRGGLWRYSRHPNYFFEWLHWCAYPLFAWGSPHLLLALSGPLLMYLFLRWITGVPHVERRSLASRGEAYRDYQKTTSAFWPWIPRKLQTD